MLPLNIPLDLTLTDLSVQWYSLLGFSVLGPFMLFHLDLTEVERDPILRNEENKQLAPY